jgi:glycosyltransferase involved in cell wall biosynthesis
VAAFRLSTVRQGRGVGSQLAVISTHPVQYHAPVYREIQRLGLPVTAIYGSDFSVTGYHDHEFDVAFSWSTDLLSGYSSVFLSRVAEGGAATAEATSARGLSKELLRISPDAVLLTGYWPGYLRRAALQSLVQRQRILFRAETSDHARERAWLKGSARDLVLRQFYEKCCALIYIGKRSREHFERLGARGRELFFSPYCVDASVFQSDELSRERLRASTRAELGLRSDQIVLVFAGKLIHRKGPDLLVDAIQELPAELRRRLAILFLGDGEMRTILAERLDAVTLRFVGFQNQHQLSRYYHASDALVLPSRSSETWGLVVNEALLHGLPCLVSAGVGCAWDLVVPGKTGEIFETDSAVSLRENLGQLLGWLRDDAGIRDRCRRQLENYSVNAAAKGIIAAFEATVTEGAVAHGSLL